MPRPHRIAHRLLIAVLAIVGLVVPLTGSGLADASPSHHTGPKPTIVLVHGDWADGSSWNAVIARLQDRGYTVVAPPNPLRGATDAPYLAAFLESVTGPIVLVAHSYGGFVITNAATGNTNVNALVYIDAFIPDEGQTTGDLNPDSCLNTATAFKVVPVPGDVDLYLQAAPSGPYQGFEECFANGVNRRDAAVLFATQRPASAAQLAFVSGPPAWKTTPLGEAIPAWALIGTADRVITPTEQRAMAEHANAHIDTVNAGHLSLITRPNAVVKTIVTASDAAT